MIDSEPTPTDMPEAHGKDIVMTCWVDASHASNKVTMRSHTGIFIKLNGAPVAWYSKQHNTAELSTFGSEYFSLATTMRYSSARNIDLFTSHKALHNILLAIQFVLLSS